jgi:hypothetical protein
MSPVLPLFSSVPIAIAIDDAPAVDLGGGCQRRDLPAPPGMRAWVVEMAPGSVWPRIDRHDTGEAYCVLAGEVIESDRRFGAGTQVVFAPGSRHRPRTEIGVRLLGFHLTADAFLGAGGDPAALVGELHVPQG